MTKAGYNRPRAAGLLAFAFAPASPPAVPPRLVVVIAVDQLRADYLDRFRPWFGPDGFNRFFRTGAVYPRARYEHVTTETCPGHAAQISHPGSDAVVPAIARGGAVGHLERLLDLAALFERRDHGVHVVAVESVTHAPHQLDVLLGHRRPVSAAKR